MTRVFCVLPDKYSSPLFFTVASLHNIINTFPRHTQYSSPLFLWSHCLTQYSLPLSTVALPYNIHHHFFCSYVASHNIHRHFLLLRCYTIFITTFSVVALPHTIFITTFYCRVVI